MNLAEYIPAVHDIYQLLGLVVMIAFQVWQIRESRQIKHQTNGLIGKTVDEAKASALLQGEISGAAKEQARVAEKLAVASEVAAKLAQASGADAASLAAALAAPAALAAALAAPPALAVKVPTTRTPDPDIHHTE